MLHAHKLNWQQYLFKKTTKWQNNDKNITMVKHWIPKKFNKLQYKSIILR